MDIMTKNKLEKELWFVYNLVLSLVFMTSVGCCVHTYLLEPEPCDVVVNEYRIIRKDETFLK